MTKETLTLIHFNNLINDLETVISNDTNDGVSTKMFNQLMEDFVNTVNDNDGISEAFSKKFKIFINHLNTEVDSADKQSKTLSKLVLFNSKYMSDN